MPLFVSVMRIQLFTPVVTHIYLMIYFSLFTAILLAGLLIITLLCIQNCPIKILKKANGDYPAVHLDYSDSFCDYDCNKCSQVCPSGAIKCLSLAQKQKTQIGLASIDEQICVKCGLCVMKCPRQAISKADGAFPVVDASQCIGCGACANGCPVKAITIQPVAKQKIL